MQRFLGMKMISRRLLRTKILQSLYAYYNTADAGYTKPDKDLELSIKKAYDLYYFVMLLIIPVKHYAESRIELALNKKLPSYEDLNPNTRFVDNRLICQIHECKKFNKYVKHNALSWSNYPELIKKLYGKLVESQYYKEYMESAESSYEADRQLLIDFYANELEDDEMFHDILEELCIYWNDDVDLVVGRVVKTIKEMSPVSFEMLPLYKSESDPEFAFSLLHATIRNYDEYHKLIDSYVVNWDIERVAHVDNLVLQMAVNELVEFPTIPIKVTFDEYLELSKFYSTPKSSLFINGLLDKILEDLTLSGKIIKFEEEESIV